MAHLHKLYCRLALLNDAMTLLVTLAAAACQRPLTGPSGGGSVPVAAVTLSLASASLTAGQTVQLTATPKDANGNPLSGRVITWTSSAAAVAAVSGSGLVTGVAVGSATITATSEGQSGTAAVTVSVPPPPPPGGSWPNEPAGFTQLTDRSFAALLEDGWQQVPANNPYYSIQVDASAPQSPPYVGEALFPAGFGSGSAPIQVWKAISGYTKLYLAFWWKESANWYGNGVNDKIIYVWIHGNPSVYIVDVGGGSSALHSEVRLQNAPDGGTNFSYTGAYGSNTRLYGAPNLWQGTPGAADVVLTRSVWHLWEIVLVCNTAGNYDGYLQWWIDGTKVGYFQGIAFANASASHQWEQVDWQPVYGGNGSPVPADQFMRIDHLHASGGN